LYRLVSDWVKNIILLVFFSYILEMFIPNNDLKKYIRMIMGFLVILVIISPLLNVFSKDFEFNDFNISILQTSTDLEIQRVINAGEEMEQRYHDQALTHYKTMIARQMENHLTNLVQEKNSKIYVEVNLFDDIEKETFGKLKEVNIVLEIQDNEEDIIKQPIKIKINSGAEIDYIKSKTYISKLENNIKDIISKDYDIPKKTVHIEVRKDEGL